MTTVIAQLSDPHLHLGPGDRGSAEALAAAVRAVLDLPNEPDGVLVTGDIAEHGAAEEYARVRELLAPLSMPVYVLPGNHDDRDALREAFAVPGAAGEPLQYTARCGDLRLVMCDTQRPGHDGGALDGGRLEWLEAQLADDPDTPTMLALHHPPVAIGIPGIDEFGVPEPDRAALGELLARAPQVRRIVTGHVHRAVAAWFAGRTVVTCASTHLQARLEIDATKLSLIEAQPCFALHVALDGEVASHVVPI